MHPSVRLSVATPPIVMREWLRRTPEGAWRSRARCVSARACSRSRAPRRQPRPPLPRQPASAAGLRTWGGRAWDPLVGMARPPRGSGRPQDPGAGQPGHCASLTPHVMLAAASAAGPTPGISAGDQHFTLRPIPQNSVSTVTHGSFGVPCPPHPHPTAASTRPIFECTPSQHETAWYVLQLFWT